MRLSPRASFSTALALAAALSGLASQSPRAAGQQDASASGKDTYDQIKAFALTGGTAGVTNLALTRDRVTMTFTGTFHFAAPAGGRVTGAVFIGEGTMRADVPPSDFERDNVRRMIGADLLESDFKTVVLRWSDDTFELISGARRDGGTAPAAARDLAVESDTRFTRETGANLPARLAISLLNGETPGVFSAQFDGGRRGRFTYLLDHQGRIPVANFHLNGGEKGIIFAYQSALMTNDVWMAFYSIQDYEKKIVQYSDAHDLADITHYRLNLDLREFRRRIGLVARIEMQSRASNMRAIPFKVGESLPLSQNMRLKNQLRVKEARLGTQAVSWVQEDWEGGFTVFLPQPAQRDQALILEVVLDGDFMDGGDIVPECYYPIDNVSWLPRHGYLDRATLDMTFLHRRLDRIAAIGTRTSEQPDTQDREAFVTRYRMSEPVALAVFALGPFQRKTQQVTWESGGASIPLEFNSVPSRVASIKHEFILAELDNAVRYFAAMFGPYPYETFGAAFHPYPFGQGFPSLLMIPPTDRENKYTHAFIAHETAHQWWGNIVAWRSYRDQWLSEGFAEYSGLLYAGKRDREGVKAAAVLIRELRDSLREPPRTSTGLGKGRLNDIGPIVLGLRLNTSKSRGAYQALIYNKGALVLRMLHFLMSNPATLDDSAFVAMMKDFVERHRNGTATTDDFRNVANQHFARTPVAQKFGLRDLDWFFRQWVYGTGLPAYQLEYEVATRPEGTFVTGVIKQDNVDKDWLMVLPVVFSFDGGQEGRTTIRALGPATLFELKLPSAPRKVELDPASWVLSEKTTSRAK